MRPGIDGRYPNSPAGVKEAMKSVPEGRPYEHLVDWDDDGSQHNNEMRALAALALAAKEKRDVFTPEELQRISEHVGAAGSLATQRAVETVDLHGDYM